MSSRPNIEAIAFDLDNTLIDRDGAFRRLVTDWVSAVALPKNPFIEDIVTDDNQGHSDRDEFFHNLAEMGVFSEDGAELRNRFSQEFPGYFHPDPKIQGLLRRLQEQKIELAVLSNGGSEMQWAKLKNSELTDFFEPEKILISGEIGYDKPATEAFDLLAEKLETPREQTLFVGDHLQNDIAGAAACGFQTCWVSPEPAGVDESKKPPFDFKITTLAELESTCLT